LSNHDTLGFPVIEENLQEVTDFCVRINTTDFDKGVDCNAKLSDLAMTALTLIKLFKQNVVLFIPIKLKAMLTADWVRDLNGRLSRLAISRGSPPCISLQGAWTTEHGEQWNPIVDSLY